VSFLTFPAHETYRAGVNSPSARQPGTESLCWAWELTPTQSFGARVAHSLGPCQPALLPLVKGHRRFRCQKFSWYNDETRTFPLIFNGQVRVSFVMLECTHELVVRNHLGLMQPGTPRMFFSAAESLPMKRPSTSREPLNPCSQPVTVQAAIFPAAIFGFACLWRAPGLKREKTLCLGPATLALTSVRPSNHTSFWPWQMGMGSNGIPEDN
jgi:hypothetical protein